MFLASASYEARRAHIGAAAADMTKEVHTAPPMQAAWVRADGLLGIAEDRGVEACSPLIRLARYNMYTCTLPEVLRRHPL